MAQPPVLVFGAAGHTARFVIEELQRRGRRAVLAGRDARTLEAAYPEAEVRVASTTDAGALDRALAGCSAVINCAGPYLDSAAPLIEAALRARIHYLDLTAEQASALDTFERYARPAEAAGVVVLPAMAFFGGLADLLATAAMGDWSEADEVTVAVALDSWQPTLGTRRTGQRNTFRRQVISGGQLVPLADPPPRRTWTFAEPFGAQEVVGLPLSETITLSRHLRAREVHSFMNLVPLGQLRDPATPAPTAADESGRSAQTFLMEVVARKGATERRASARGRDIYAVTGPLVVEALERVLDGRSSRPGARAPGELLDARDVLAALSPEPLTVEYAPGR